MSRNDWEHGVITLPSAEFAKVRQAVQQADAAHKEKVFDLTQEFWKGLSRKEQTDNDAYVEAQHRFIAAKDAQTPRPSFGWGAPKQDPAMFQVLDDVHYKLELGWRQPKPARVLKSEMDFPSNRTTGFNTGEANISFNRENNTVEWSVGENNRAVERAHEHPLARVLFRQLGEVKWTRGTGGVFTGNDEYNEDNRDAGGGANYVTTAYGPIGADQEPGHCAPYTDSKGKKVTREDLSRMSQEKFQAQWDMQRKMGAASRRAKTSSASNRGSFAPTQHGEPNFRLRQ